MSKWTPALSIIGLSLLFTGISCFPAYAEDTAQALAEIANTADSICGTVTAAGRSNSVKVTGDIKAELSGLFKKLANLGVSGSGEMTHSDYEGVLQQQLAGALNDLRQCKLKVFNILQEKLLPDSNVEELSENNKLLGFAAYAVIRIHDIPALQRKYIYDFSTPASAHTAFYLSASDKFTFSVTDTRGENYPLEVRLGNDGVPIEQFVVLFCEVGVGSSATVLRVLVNGGEVEHRDLPFPIDLGSRQWKAPALGASSVGSNNGAFDITELGAFATTLTTAEVVRLIQNIKGFYGLSIH